MIFALLTSFLAFVLATGSGGGAAAPASSTTGGGKTWTGTKLLGAAEWDVGSGVAVGSSGNIYVTGWIYGRLDGKTLQAGEDIFLVKYDSNGVKQ